MTMVACVMLPQNNHAPSLRNYHKIDFCRQIKTPAQFKNTLERDSESESESGLLAQNGYEDSGTGSRML